MGAPRRFAAATTLSLTLLSIGRSGMVPAPIAAAATAQGAATTVSGTPATQMCPITSSNVPVAAEKAGEVFTIDSDKSTAGYTAQEVLTGKRDNTAVGTILLSSSGEALPCSVFYVDLRTLISDEGWRDGQVQKVLEAEIYPLGTFILTSVEGQTGSLTDGSEHTVKLIGDLTVHNVTKTVTWDAMRRSLFHFPWRPRTVRHHVPTSTIERDANSGRPLRRATNSHRGRSFAPRRNIPAGVAGGAGLV
ncbi:MAG: YceI family protein [Thermomicrobiales bacterium]